MLILGHEPGGCGCILVTLDPNASGRDAPEARLRFVERDLAAREQRAHLVGLVVRNVAQIEEQFRNSLPSTSNIRV
jgi:hypothetical protein